MVLEAFQRAVFAPKPYHKDGFSLWSARDFYRTDEFTTTDASKTFFASMERYFAMRVLKHGRGGEGEGIFKEIAKSAIEERQVVGVHDMRMLCYG